MSVLIIVATAVVALLVAPIRYKATIAFNVVISVTNLALYVVSVAFVLIPWHHRADSIRIVNRARSQHFQLCWIVL